MAGGARNAQRMALAPVVDRARAAVAAVRTLARPRRVLVMHVDGAVRAAPAVGGARYDLAVAAGVLVPESGAEGRAARRRGRPLGAVVVVVVVAHVRVRIRASRAEHRISYEGGGSMRCGEAGGGGGAGLE